MASCLIRDALGWPCEWELWGLLQIYFLFVCQGHKRIVCLCATLAEGEGIAFGSVCLSVFCLPAQNFCVFLRNHLSDWDEIFTIGATPHVKCFNDNYDIIGHVVWQSCLKNGKTLDLYLWNRTKEKIETWHIGKYPTWGISAIFSFIIIIISPVRRTEL